MLKRFIVNNVGKSQVLATIGYSHEVLRHIAPAHDFVIVYTRNTFSTSNAAFT